jgi:hypothetical protein
MSLEDIKNDLRDIKYTLANINNELTNIKQELQLHTVQLNDISKNSDKMDNHISFVENIYDIVKSPFEKTLSYYYGNTVELEKIKRIE